MASESHWRRTARAVIGGVIATGQRSEHTDYEILNAIDRAYPFGPRKHAPYKYWLEERGKAMSAISKNPLMRVCPACGAGLTRLCKDIEGDELKAHRMVLEDARKFYKGQGSPEIAKRLYALEELCVHSARQALVPAAKHDDLPLWNQDGSMNNLALMDKDEREFAERHGMQEASIMNVRAAMMRGVP